MSFDLVQMFAFACARVYHYNSFFSIGIDQVFVRECIWNVQPVRLNLYIKSIDKLYGAAKMNCNWSNK